MKTKNIIKVTAAAFVIFSMVAFTNVSHAQDENNGQTANGNWLIEMNTGFGNGTAAHTANTGFGLASSDGTTIWSVGGETGYFIDDDLALKLGLGYTDFDGISAFSYKFGAKYYAASIVPVQLDVTGASWKDADENPLWLGIQGGYAIFLGDMVSAEPGIRYNISLNEDFTDEGVLELRFGFVLHL